MREEWTKGRNSRVQCHDCHDDSSTWTRPSGRRSAGYHRRGREGDGKTMSNQVAGRPQHTLNARKHVVDRVCWGGINVVVMTIACASNNRVQVINGASSAYTIEPLRYFQHGPFQPVTWLD